MSLIKSLFAFILTISIAWFCIINAQSVEIKWSPVHDALTLPLYTAIIGGLIIGFVVGALSMWINDGNLRKTKRQQKKQIKNLEKELSRTNINAGNQKPPSDFFPALSHKSDS